MNKHDIDKAYVSPYDKFLRTFDANHSMSPSQIKEFLKYKRIFELRDNPNAGDEVVEIWEEF